MDYERRQSYREGAAGGYFWVALEKGLGGGGVAFEEGVRPKNVFFLWSAGF